MVKYEFVDVGESSTGVKIQEGEYIDLVLEYGKVSFDEKEEELKLNFEYTVIENPNKIEPSKELYTLMGAILVDIIRNDLKLDDN